MKNALLTVVMFGFALTCMALNAHAQMGDITFSRVVGGPESMVDSIDFNFNTTATVSLDALGPNNAYDVINGVFSGIPSVGLFLVSTSTSTPTPTPTGASFGLVAPGDVIDPNDSETTSTFSNELNLLTAAAIGDDLFVGFISDINEVGFFEVTFTDPDGPGDPDWNGTITFSNGLWSSSAIVVPTGIPEPSSTVILGLFASLAATRRKR